MWQTNNIFLSKECIALLSNTSISSYCFMMQWIQPFKIWSASSSPSSIFSFSVLIIFYSLLKRLYRFLLWIFLKIKQEFTLNIINLLLPLCLPKYPIELLNSSFPFFPTSLGWLSALCFGAVFQPTFNFRESLSSM